MIATVQQLERLVIALEGELICPECGARVAVGYNMSLMKEMLKLGAAELRPRCAGCGVRVNIIVLYLRRWLSDSGRLAELIEDIKVCMIKVAEGERVRVAKELMS